MKRGDQKIFRLTKEQFKEWDIFCTKHGTEMYKNKDSYEISYDSNLEIYSVCINITEQSGMNNFLMDLTTL